jgi:predicted DNA-binding transcriptional regulator YafY
MAHWIKEAPVKIRVTTAQAQQLRRDRYYGHAHFSEPAQGEWIMTFGEANQAFVFELVRWLGVGAELLEPHPWRAELRNELTKMIEQYG